MTKPTWVAAYIDDDTFEVALTGRFGTPIVERFPNNVDGLSVFVDWAHPHVKDVNVRWCATVPKGDGGIAYDWFDKNTCELFLQNPARLKEYAERNGLPWQSAETLRRFNESKVWN